MPESDGQKATCMVNMDFLRDLDVFNEWMNDADYRVGDDDEILDLLNDKDLQTGAKPIFHWHKTVLFSNLNKRGSNFSHWHFNPT